MAKPARAPKVRTATGSFGGAPSKSGRKDKTDRSTKPLRSQGGVPRAAKGRGK